MKNPISVDSAVDLIAHVSAKDIRTTLFAFIGNKSPGPNGFNAFFFKECWDTVGNDVVRAVNELFNTGALLKQINNMIISLVLKVINLTQLSDFWFYFLLFDHLQGYFQDPS